PCPTGWPCTPLPAREAPCFGRRTPSAVGLQPLSWRAGFVLPDAKASRRRRGDPQAGGAPAPCKAHPDRREREPDLKEEPDRAAASNREPRRPRRRREAFR